jgi:D-inositol-3-phosphate glycosyltransferase
MSTDRGAFHSPMRRVAVISLHTSPLLQPGSGDSGGMNVYVREVVSALAQSGVDCITYTRADREGLPAEVVVEPNHRIVHVEAGPHHLPKEALPEVIDEFTDRVLEHLESVGGADVVHANYWLSGVAAHRIKHELDIPFVSTFHTLARVKAEGGDPESGWRDRAEAELVNCADAVCVSCPDEEQQFRRLYGDPRSQSVRGQVEIVAPGVEHALFGPGDRRGARAAIGRPDDVPIVLFVGRIQPLKGPDVAIRALHALRRDDARLLIVGGASGSDGEGETERAHQLVDELGLHDRVEFVPPQPHHILSSYYRAADVVVVPSRSESFGLVALEASACGVPVVASAVGGLQSLVDDGVTGFLVPDRDPRRFAEAIDRILADPLLAASMSVAAAERAGAYTWAAAAHRLRTMYGELAVRELVAGERP